MADALGRREQSASNPAGNGKIKAPVTTSTWDARDGKNPNYHESIAATRETPKTPNGRGMHDAGLIGC